MFCRRRGLHAHFLDTWYSGLDYYRFLWRLMYTRVFCHTSNGPKNLRFMHIWKISNKEIDISGIFSMLFLEYFSKSAPKCPLFRGILSWFFIRNIIEHSANMEPCGTSYNNRWYLLKIIFMTADSFLSTLSWCLTKNNKTDPIWNPVGRYYYWYGNIYCIVVQNYWANFLSQSGTLWNIVVACLFEYLKRRGFNLISSIGTFFLVE